jgi:hypothetical protein
VNVATNSIQTDSVLHGQRDFVNDFASPGDDNGHSNNLVRSRLAYNFDETGIVILKDCLIIVLKTTTINIHLHYGLVCYFH